ncbi:MAG: tRNA 5-methoxyuridine(34)/uridine 5-oxyacetic acid(34) synthase CmoB [Gammaproteobacteria bacterium]|nr:tRNA 5-methoxyuridine(34)/uridine 5-oxyacetic acid(34) synthase CmoB [Gammaproteobacteria bacterium]
MSPRAADAGLRPALECSGLAALAAPLADAAARARREHRHGDLPKWENALAQLDCPAASPPDFALAAPRIGGARDCDDAERARMKKLLLQLRPWRKGPFEFFGMRVDAEWRADRKWARIEKHIDLRGARALDIGCGNGYYLLRMLGAGAAFALGIDPGQLFIAQFAALKRGCPNSPAFALPLACEDFPRAPNFKLPGFDAVFSMGVLSHRRDPHAHLREVLQCARPGGQVVVETLVVEDETERVFVPPGRYAKMRNVRAIPSPPMLAAWLRRAGARDVRPLGVSRTTPDEQRATEWMRSESLADFLDPNDAEKTIEGHPAPRRAIFLCERGE